MPIEVFNVVIYQTSTPNTSYSYLSVLNYAVLGTGYKSNIGAVDPIKGPAYASMTCSEKFIFNPYSVDIYLTNIMPYLPLSESST